MPVTFKVNNVSYTSNRASTTPLLWVLRDEFDLTETKYGCGIVRCFACTVIMGGNAMRTCNTSLNSASGKTILTVAAPRGLDPLLDKIRDAWVAFQVPQCGYCQSGMIMAVSALLTANPNPSDDEIDGAITNICRCGTYPRVRKAIRSLTTTA